MIKIKTIQIITLILITQTDLDAQSEDNQSPRSLSFYSWLFKGEGEEYGWTCHNISVDQFGEHSCKPTDQECKFCELQNNKQPFWQQCVIGIIGGIIANQFMGFVKDITNNDKSDNNTETNLLQEEEKKPSKCLSNLLQQGSLLIQFSQLILSFKVDVEEIIAVYSWGEGLCWNTQNLTFFTIANSTIIRQGQVIIVSLVMNDKTMHMHTKAGQDLRNKLQSHSMILAPIFMIQGLMQVPFIFTHIITAVFCQGLIVIFPLCICLIGIFTWLTNCCEDNCLIAQITKLVIVLIALFWFWIWTFALNSVLAWYLGWSYTGAIYSTFWSRSQEKWLWQTQNKLEGKQEKIINQVIEITGI